MKVKFYKPTTPSRRFSSRNDFFLLSKKKPEKKETKGKKRISGRDSLGHISVRFRGGGHKRSLRFIDFKRRKLGIPAKVFSIEYDPNRSARISLLHYFDGEKKYIITSRFMHVGQILNSGIKAPIKDGNSLPIYKIPLGTILHNIEIRPEKGGQLVRSAGTSAQLIAKSENYSTIKLPSGELRKIYVRCFATIGQVSNSSHNLVHYGKAGKTRWLGFRPHNRGVSMNPIDHPLGGGEGKSSGGRHPTSPWGKPTKGYRTRKNERTKNMIVNRRIKKR
jgi:large subunit ribosomal protein L2